MKETKHENEVTQTYAKTFTKSPGRPGIAQRKRNANREPTGKKSRRPAGACPYRRLARSRPPSRHARFAPPPNLRSFEIDAKTLRRHYKPELAEGMVAANEQVLETLFDMATSGRCAAATIFWAKTRCGLSTARSQSSRFPNNHNDNDEEEDDDDILDPEEDCEEKAARRRNRQAAAPPANLPKHSQVFFIDDPKPIELPGVAEAQQEAREWRARVAAEEAEGANQAKQTPPKDGKTNGRTT